mmetsp:Transcript_25904/g.56132  ORF Transcript_25904/g.56132 Transcript_25904/m.56132 type:complete len:165 (-) Transcript_25904:5-499(-)
MDVLSTSLHTMKPGDLVMAAAKESGYWASLQGDQDAKDNIEELARAVEMPLDWTEEGEEGLGGNADNDANHLLAFLDRAVLSGAKEQSSDESTGRVTLVTAHLAKGLEWPVVFVAGMFQGSFPHYRSFSEEGDDERRLAYVAFTRAMDCLFLTWSIMPQLAPPS